MIKPAIAAALLLGPQVAVSAQAAKPCVTRAEAADMTLFFLPTLVDRMAEKCRASLPRTSFLAGSGKAFGERVKREGGDRWPSVKSALLKIAGDQIPPALSDGTLRRMSEEIIGAELAKDLKIKDCAAIDEAFALLAPLPADNLGRLGALLIVMGEKRQETRQNRDARPFTICPAQSS
jgi:hypothetical protein